jgi:hypothetical protein
MTLPNYYVVIAIFKPNHLAFPFSKLIGLAFSPWNWSPSCQESRPKAESDALRGTRCGTSQGASTAWPPKAGPPGKCLGKCLVIFGWFFHEPDLFFEYPNWRNSHDIRAANEPHKLGWCMSRVETILFLSGMVSIWDNGEVQNVKAITTVNKASTHDQTHSWVDCSGTSCILLTKICWCFNPKVGNITLLFRDWLTGLNLWAPNVTATSLRELQQH